jgi:hypothetical protein
MMRMPRAGCHQGTAELAPMRSTISSGVAGGRENENMEKMEKMGSGLISAAADSPVSPRASEMRPDPISTSPAFRTGESITVLISLREMAFHHGGA